MSRSGYTDDCEDWWELIRWRGAVKSAMRGKRGQAFFRELLAALDAMPEKRLIPNSFGAPGAYCTLGVIGAARGVSMPEIDDDDDYIADVSDDAAAALDIPRALAAEVMHENDEGGWYAYGHTETPEERWSRMRAWIAKQIKEPPHDH